MKLRGTALCTFAERLLRALKLARCKHSEFQLVIQGVKREIESRANSFGHSSIEVTLARLMAKLQIAQS